MTTKRTSQRTKKYTLAKCPKSLLEAFQGIEDPEAARYAEFQFFGGDEFLLIVEPSTLQIHEEGSSWGIFADDVPVSMETYALGILQMVADGRIGSTADFSRVLKLMRLT